MEKTEDIKLNSLSVGSRISFIRKIRGMTQQELGNAIGIEGVRARNIICRYERTARVPRSSILQDIADALDIDVRLIKKYDFKDPMDIYYLMIWTEEICPNFIFNKVNGMLPQNSTQKVLTEKYTDWHRMRLKRNKNEITQEAFRDWKLVRRETV